MNGNSRQTAQVALAVLSNLIFAGTFYALWLKGDQANLGLMIGAVIACWTQANHFFFGTSSGSARKDDTIAANAAALAVSSPVQPAPQPDPKQGG